MGQCGNGAGGSRSWSYSSPQDNVQRHNEPICEWPGPLPLRSLARALKCHLDCDAFANACVPPGNILGQISPETQQASFGNQGDGTSQLTLQAMVSPQGPTIPSSPNTPFPPLFYSGVISSPMPGSGLPPNLSPASGHRSPGMAVRPTLPIAGAQSGADPAVPPLPAAHHNGPAAVRKGWEHNEAASTALFREPSQLLGKKGRRKKKRGVGGEDTPPPPLG